LRVIEVWTDEYKKFYYKTNPEFKSVKTGDLSKRIELRKRLKCKSFKWYLKNVYPEAPLPKDFLYYGEVLFKLI
jgi:polypeptide N-acetylgalactosaminyltransferase